MPYTPLAVANTFIARHGGERGIEHMKLQKLDYYAHGWWLAYEPAPLMVEAPEVWKFGPVFDSLYRTLCPFGSRPINAPQRPSPFEGAPIIEDERVIQLVDWIWNRYGAYSSFKLSEMTHEPGTPWHQLAEANSYNVPKHFQIPHELVAEYFKKEAEKLQGA